MVTLLYTGLGKSLEPPIGAAEIIKRRIPGLHQNTHIGSVDITDTWEPLEEGLNRLETIRHVSIIAIYLSKLPLDSKLPGYQPPIPEKLVKPLLGGESPLQSATGDSR